MLAPKGAPSLKVYLLATNWRDILRAFLFACAIMVAMKLSHPFSCRVSASPYNAVVLCKACHAKACHSTEEEAYYSRYARLFVEMHIRQGNYVLQQRDVDFICEYYPKELVHNMLYEMGDSGVPYPTAMCT